MVSAKALQKIAQLFFAFITNSSLHAEGISEEALGSIYVEAMWFVGVFSVMAIISFVISSRNAKAYAQKEKLRKRTDEPKRVNVEKKEEADAENTVQIDRLIALSKLLKEGHITEAEFQQFKAKLLR